ncbi:MAG: FG-GAP-like repeat-containing protein, partial [Myxococcota bacterium]|nr:FG-GAP-like repeat-containing protein [Myxococcota bacterium]
DGNPCTVDSCAEAQCHFVQVDEGSPCDDGDLSTYGDTCESGTCGGTSYECTPGPCDEAAGAEHQGDGTCAFPSSKDAGTECEDGVLATWGDTCDGSGTCVGGTSGEGQVSSCGDGIVIGNETCDDGNAVSFDGCSSTCQHQCSAGSDGSVEDAALLTPEQGGFAILETPFHDMGRSVAELGDIDGDGVRELAVGQGATTDGGSLYVLFMNQDNTVRETQFITRFHLAPWGTGEVDDFGASVTFLGDLNGDGAPEIAVGDPEHGVNHGAVWILSLYPNGSVKSAVEIRNGVSGLGASDIQSWVQFGSSLAAIGDLDGDGTPDLAVGANPTNNFHMGAV